MTSFTDQDLRDIQGFGIAGFNKDHQEAIFVKITSPAAGKQLLEWLAPQVANAFEVGTFNKVFSEVRSRTGGQELLKATWTAVMLSAAGFSVLGIPLDDLPPGEAAEAFQAGMAARQAQIGDTRDGDAPEQWIRPFRPGVAEAHIAIVVAADDECDLDRQVVNIYEKVVDTGCELMFRERGATLPPPLTGHEHFGFKDGISQPDIVDYEDPPAAGEPAAIAPGEFVLGHADQAGVTVGAGTRWANGSYVAFRRLTQDVIGFRTLANAGVPGSDPALTSSQLAAKMVGRWPSGAPVELNADADPGTAGVSNAFAFNANSDPDGHNCPVWAHIRKANPRDETTPGGSADDPTRHRMIRRGIPFGAPLPASATADDGVQRGLHFFCVVGDLARQFEFVQRNWMNNPNFPIGGAPPQPGGAYSPPTPGIMPGGPDPVVGAHDAGVPCVLHQSPSGDHPFPLGGEVVHVTAGEYFFLPPVSAVSAIGNS